MILLRGTLERLVNYIWYRGGVLSWCLLPLSWPVRWVVRRRRRQAPAKGSTPPGVSVIVVGGLTAGGTGKTPVLIALGKWLMEQGYRVGVVSRGYKGLRTAEPHWVAETDSAAVVGDEPALIRRDLKVPVLVCRDRKMALNTLAQSGQVDVVLSDDGLQHYGMSRDVEIVVLDAERGLGNGRLLPAGPLREPGSRLASVDSVLERNSDDPGRGFRYQPTLATHVATGRTMPWQDCLADWRQQTVVALTGLGQPGQFFTMLIEQGLGLRTVALADHEAITAAHLESCDESVILVTAKDAVKLPRDTDPRVWVVEIEVALPASLLSRLKGLLPPPAQTGC